MTDEEVICAFMEPEADLRIDSDFEWWGQIWSNGVRSVFPRTLTLDALWEVEERLTTLQAVNYAGLLLDGQEGWTWHATAAQKIKALATVLRA